LNGEVITTLSSPGSFIQVAELPLSLTFHLLLPAAVRSDFNCRGVLSQSPKGKRISDLNATLVNHGENGAQRMVQLDASVRQVINCLLKMMMILLFD
jgi:hypothetical protein